MDKDKNEKRQRRRKKELVNNMKEKIMNIIIVSSIIIVCFSIFLIMLIRTDNAVNNFIGDEEQSRVLCISFDNNILNIEIVGKEYEIKIKNK